MKIVLTNNILSDTYTAVQSQNALSVHSISKQMLPLALQISLTNTAM